MGADPTTSRVTGECSTVELQPHNYFGNVTDSDTQGNRVPMSGIEPLSRACLPPHQFELECRRADLNCRPGAYETPALTTELPRH